MANFCRREGITSLVIIFITEPKDLSRASFQVYRKINSSCVENNHKNTAFN